MDALRPRTAPNSSIPTTQAEVATTASWKRRFIGRYVPFSLNSIPKTKDSSAWFSHTPRGVRNSRHAHDSRHIADDVDHTPITYTDAPVIFVALQFLHPAGLGLSLRQFNSSDNPNPGVIRQRFEFLPR